MTCEERLRTLGLSILEKERLREVMGNVVAVSTSPVRVYEEKEPASSQRYMTAICCNKKILMDIWWKKQVTLEYLPRDSGILIFRRARPSV